ncbi:MAG: hypothetical protein HUK17_04950 [Bacteroidales bacterium]|nr:hypothetical protein [Bacteroidales bacterium]
MQRYKEYLILQKKLFLLPHPTVSSAGISTRRTSLKVNHLSGGIKAVERLLEDLPPH